MTFRLAGWSCFGASDHGPLSFQRVGQSVDLPDKARRWGHDLRGSRQSGCLKSVRTPTKGCPVVPSSYWTYSGDPTTRRGVVAVVVRPPGITGQPLAGSGTGAVADAPFPVPAASNRARAADVGGGAGARGRPHGGVHRRAAGRTGDVEALVPAVAAPRSGAAPGAR